MTAPTLDALHAQAAALDMKTSTLLRQIIARGLARARATGAVQQLARPGETAVETKLLPLAPHPREFVGGREHTSG